MENETKIVRLTSHEEIIGRVTTTDTGVSIKDPLILIPTQQKSLALAPWMPTPRLPLTELKLTVIVSCSLSLLTMNLQRNICPQCRVSSFRVRSLLVMSLVSSVQMY